MMSIAGFLWTISVALATTSFAAQAAEPKDSGKPPAEPTPTRYTAMCDASAGISLDANHFVVADDEKNVLQIYRRGTPEPVNSIPVWKFLGTDPDKESDLEGAAAIGTRIYWISSHALNNEGKAQERRLRFFATKFEAGAVPSLSLEGRRYENLKTDLLAAQHLEPLKLKAAATRKPEDPNGFNIEGLAATPEGRLLIGFRNPLSEAGAAYLVPLENPAQLIESDKETAKLGAPISVPLGRRGIRSIERIGSDYFIVAGPTGKEGSFEIYRWSGKEGQNPVAVPNIGLGMLRPEALFAIPGTPSAWLLSDDGTVKTAGTECKDEEDKAKRSFRAITVTLGSAVSTSAAMKQP